MMKIPQKTALNFSLFIILLYWLYELCDLNHTGILPGNFSEFVLKIVIIKSIHLSVIVLLLRIEKAGWHEMGFTFKNWKKQLLVGLLLGFIMFLLINVGLTSLLAGIFPQTKSDGSILSYFSDPGNLYMWLAIGIFGGGLVEETMRIFFLTRFQKRFGKAGLYFALICSSFIFGAGHLYQGIATAISTGVSGLILGSIFIKRKSAIELITLHAFSDVLAILGAYQMANHS